tara:strand:+ start:603 stop:884 length:282 start_codon:yes stop_codon:yes gene_type:complete
MKKLVNGQIVDMTAEEISARQTEEQAWNDGAFSRDMENLRAKRNKLLAETDFYALSDVTMSSEMETYRQELRDLTNGLTTTADVEAVVFPTKP